MEATSLRQSPLPITTALQLLESSIDGIVTFDREFRYTFWNAAMWRMWGMEPDDVIGHQAFDMFPFLVETGEDALYRRALEGETSESKERVYRVHAEGRTGYYQASYGPLHDEAGQIIGGIAIIREQTEPRRAREDLREAELRFRGMADAAPVLLWMSGSDGLCTFFNQTWLEFTGRTQEEEWGVGWAEGVHFEDFQRCMDTYREAFNARQMFGMEYRLRRADGEYRWILDRGVPRFSPDGAFAGYIGSCIDITDLKSVEGELRRAVDLRDDFLSVASHELRTPMTALRLVVDRIARAVGEPAANPSALRRSAAAAVTQVERLATLVDVLLDVSRIASGHLDLRLQPVDLERIATDVVDRWKPVALRSGCALSLSACGPATGRWDEVRCRQIFDNLLSNAVKYGAGEPITVSLEVSDAAVHIVVKDQGIGIEGQDHDRIFRRFERAAPTANYGGLGLGLWITREIVQAMGGVIRVQSAPGRGATFEVELPRGR